MKVKRSIGVALVVTLAISFAYWFGYQHGSSSTQARLNVLKEIKQIGLAPRNGRNDLSRFQAAGDVTGHKGQTQ